MKSKGTKNLFINLDGVLVNLDHECCIENFKKIGFQNIEEESCTHQLDGISLQQEKGLIIPAEFCDGIREMMGKTVSDKQVDAIWNGLLVDIPTYKFDSLLKLREKYVVYLLSSINDIHQRWVCKDAFPYRTFKVEGYSEKAYLPHEMKVAKPEPEIFKAVAEDVGIDPKETFFIDDPEINCKIAQELDISIYTPKAGEDWSHLFGKK